MKKMWVILCVVAIASLPAWAQDRSLSSARAHTGQSMNAPETVAPQTVVKHVLKNVYNSKCVESGGSCPFVGLAGGLNPIDSSITVSCPGTTGTCLIQADQWVQFGFASGDAVAICFFVDGASVNGCYNEGGASAGAFTMYSVSQGITVTHGNHTVQTQVYDFNGGSEYLYYNFNYSVFKP